MTITPPSRPGTPIRWKRARRSRGRDAAAPERLTAARWLAHPAWAGIGVLVATALSLVSIWLAVTGG